MDNYIFRPKAELGGRYLSVLNCVEPGIGRNRAKTIVELVQVELFLTTTDCKDGRMEPREATLRVKGNKGHADVTVCRIFSLVECNNVVDVFTLKNALVCKKNYVVFFLR